MQKLLFFVFPLFSNSLFAQRGFLYAKKKGYKKVRTFQQGSLLKFRTKDDQIVFGTMALVKKDSILVINYWFASKTLRQSTSARIIIILTHIHFGLRLQV